jgi:hypothetical protein
MIHRGAEVDAGPVAIRSPARARVAAGAVVAHLIVGAGRFAIAAMQGVARHVDAVPVAEFERLVTIDAARAVGTRRRAVFRHGALPAATAAVLEVAQRVDTYVAARVEAVVAR